MALLSTLLTAAVLAPGSSAFTSEPGRFKATFPTEPAYTVDSMHRWEEGFVPIHRYEAKGDSCTMAVLYFDLPYGASPRTERSLAQQHVAAMTKGREESIVERKQYAMGGLPVEMARVTETSELQSLSFVVVKGSRVYQVVTTGTAQNVQGPEARAFLSSFRVL